MDFGCGEGAFLEIARRLGWRARGIDFDPAAVETARARGFEVEQGGVERLAGHREAFDHVTISHVMEHVPDPAALAAAAFRALRPGGGLFVETPNFDAACHVRFGRHWRGLEAPRHLQIPTWRGLETLLGAAGFTDVRRHPRPEMFDALYRKSAAIEAGLDPENPDDMARFAPPSEERAAAEGDAERSEYVTLTARRPAA
jgi:SAM-dependent methyltransferase